MNNHHLLDVLTREGVLVAAEHFAPSEQGFYCAGCAYQEACRAWHRDQACGRVRVAA